MRKPTQISKAYFQGFTLVEIAVVLVIVGLIFGVGISTLGAYLDNAKQNHTMNNLKLTKRATLDFVMVNYHMPCPAADDSGLEDRNLDGSCNTLRGFVPYIDIGRSKSDASDDYGNVFAYGISANAGDVTNMTALVSPANEEAYGDLEASYFANQAVANLLVDVRMPVFGLETRPTAEVPSSSSTTNYSVKNFSGGVEVEDIPAVIVAFNENGSGTSLTSCGSNGWPNEAENCDNDSVLQKDYFSDGEFDDQLVTISAYEIKQQVLDRLSGLSYDPYIPPAPEYAGYQLIVRGDVSNANTTNLGTKGDDSFYVDVDDNGDGGNLDIANLQMKDGNDKLHIEMDIVSGGGADMGMGNDYAYVGGVIAGDLLMGTGNDNTELFSGIAAGGDFDAGAGDDIVSIGGTLEGQVKNEVAPFAQISGALLMGDEPDELRIYNTLNLVVGSSAVIDGGDGEDILQIDITKTEFVDSGKAVEILQRVVSFETLIDAGNYQYKIEGTNLILKQ